MTIDLKTNAIVIEPHDHEKLECASRLLAGIVERTWGRKRSLAPKGPKSDMIKRSLLQARLYIEELELRLKRLEDLDLT